jgi:hypothetical protein
MCCTRTSYYYIVVYLLISILYCRYLYFCRETWLNLDIIDFGQKFMSFENEGSIIYYNLLYDQVRYAHNSECGF